MRETCFLSMLVIIAGVVSLHAQSGYIDQATIDRSVKPGDDFYSYSNGGWFKPNEIPITETTWGNSAIIRKQTRLLLQNPVTEVATTKNQQGSNGQKVQDFKTAAWIRLPLRGWVCNRTSRFIAHCCHWQQIWYYFRSDCAIWSGLGSMAQKIKYCPYF